MRLSWIAAIALAALANGATALAKTGAPAHAAPTVAAQAFAIEKMTCAMCPITVRKAMEAVPGVATVAVDFERKTALVRYDPARTNATAIAAASTNAGYPASVIRIRTGS